MTSKEYHTVLKEVRKLANLATQEVIDSSFKLFYTTGKEFKLLYNVFPDNQIQVYTNDLMEEDKTRIELYASITCSTSLDIFLQLLEYLTTFKAKRYVTIFYFYGSRCDKEKFATKDVLEMIINHYKQYGIEFEIFNPHHNAYKGTGQLHESLKSFEIFHKMLKLEKDFDYILFPDESAKTRYEYFVDSMELESHGIKLATCTKVRDQVSGEIVTHEFPKLYGRVLVLDDILDGGRTFLNVAENYLDCDLVLFTWHLIISNPENMDVLAENYSKIYGTNSYFGRNASKEYLSLWEDKLHVFDVWED